MSDLDDLQAQPWAFDFHTAMRRIECDNRDKPRWGEASTPAEEPARLGQDPSLAFASAPLHRYRRRPGEAPDQLRIAFFGMFGSQGALPLHLTEHARERLRDVGDRTFGAFVDLLQHRMLVLLHRAWSAARPTVAQDRPETSSFARYAASLCGRAGTGSEDRDSLPEEAKLQFVGWLAPRTRNAEGLESMVGTYFGIPARVEPFVGDWIDLAEPDRWRLGSEASGLGLTTIAGARRFERGHKFRLHLGPLKRAAFGGFLPGSRRLRALSDLTRAYVGDELCWDVALHLDESSSVELRLGAGSRMGYDTWLGRPATPVERRETLVVQPPTRA